MKLTALPAFAVGRPSSVLQGQGRHGQGRVGGGLADSQRRAPGDAPGAILCPLRRVEHRCVPSV